LCRLGYDEKASGQLPECKTTRLDRIRDFVADNRRI